MKNTRGYKTVMSRIIAQHLENIDNEIIMTKIASDIGAAGFFIPTTVTNWVRTS